MMDNVLGKVAKRKVGRPKKTVGKKPTCVGVWLNAQQREAVEAAAKASEMETVSEYARACMTQGLRFKVNKTYTLITG